MWAILDLKVQFGRIGQAKYYCPPENVDGQDIHKRTRKNLEVYFDGGPRS
jgi:hypothetical protein